MLRKPKILVLRPLNRFGSTAKYLYFGDDAWDKSHYKERALGPGLKHTLAQDMLAIVEIRCHILRDLAYTPNRIPAFTAITKLF
jgi:hypothetical protein